MCLLAGYPGLVLSMQGGSMPSVHAKEDMWEHWLRSGWLHVCNWEGPSVRLGLG